MLLNVQHLYKGLSVTVHEKWSLTIIFIHHVHKTQKIGDKENPEWDFKG